LLESCDGRQQLSPMPQRGNPDLLEILLGEQPQGFQIDMVGSERFRVLQQPQVLEPLPDIHGNTWSDRSLPLPANDSEAGPPLLTPDEVLIDVHETCKPANS
jgi:hypothetical protein